MNPHPSGRPFPRIPDRVGEWEGKHTELRRCPKCGENCVYLHITLGVCAGCIGEARAA